MNVVSEDEAKQMLMENKGLMVVFVSDPACNPCKVMQPIAERVLGEQGVRVVKIVASESPNFMARMNIQGIPTMVAFQKTIPVSAMTGSQSPDRISDWIMSVKANGDRNAQ